MPDVTDETGVAAFTALPRTKWAEIRERMKQSQVNKNSLRLIDSSATILVLEDKSIDKNVSYSRVVKLCKISSVHFCLGYLLIRYSYNYSLH